MLPRGGILRKLDATHEFEERASLHSHSWFEFARREGTLDENQTLCLVTEIERCSEWAMAVWDSISRKSSSTTGSLKLKVNKDTGNCS